MDSLFGADGVDGDNIGVLELRGGLGFIAEAGDLGWAEEGGHGEKFDGHASSEGFLDSFVDESHTATSDFADEGEITETLVFALGIDARGTAVGEGIMANFGGSAVEKIELFQVAANGIFEFGGGLEGEGEVEGFALFETLKIEVEDLHDLFALLRRKGEEPFWSVIEGVGHSFTIAWR